MARSIWRALCDADANAAVIDCSESADENGARGDDGSIGRVSRVITRHGRIAHTRGGFILEEDRGAAFLNGGFVGRWFLKGSAGGNVLGHVIGGAAFGRGGHVVDGDGAGEFSGNRPDKRHGGGCGNRSSGGRDHENVGIHSADFVALFGRRIAHDASLEDRAYRTVRVGESISSACGRCF